MNAPVKFSFLKHPKGRILTGSLIMLFLAFVGLDQVSKTEVQEKLLLEEFDKSNIRTFQGTRYRIGSIGQRFPAEDEIPFYFGLKFQYSRNPGAAFSMLASVDDSIRVPFFYGVTLVAVIMIAVLLRGLPFDQHMTRLGLVLICSGAIGNFLDRLHYGYVVDFIDVDWNLFGWYHDFAIFNVADVAINIGIILYLLDFIRLWRLSRQAEKSVAADQA